MRCGCNLCACHLLSSTNPFYLKYDNCSGLQHFNIFVLWTRQTLLIRTFFPLTRQNNCGKAGMRSIFNHHQHVWRQTNLKKIMPRPQSTERKTWFVPFSAVTAGFFSETIQLTIIKNVRTLRSHKKLWKGYRSALDRRTEPFLRVEPLMFFLMMFRILFQLFYFSPVPFALNLIGVKWLSWIRV